MFTTLRALGDKGERALRVTKTRRVLPLLNQKFAAAAAGTNPPRPQTHTRSLAPSLARSPTASLNLTPQWPCVRSCFATRCPSPGRATPHASCSSVSASVWSYCSPRGRWFLVGVGELSCVRGRDCQDSGGWRARRHVCFSLSVHPALPAPSTHTSTHACQNTHAHTVNTAGLSALPWAMWPDAGWSVVPITAVVSYLLLGIGERGMCAHCCSLVCCLYACISSHAAPWPHCRASLTPLQSSLSTLSSLSSLPCSHR